ncbi:MULTISPECIES: hypothetical protein [unclassified Cyanobium]|uniref:hypothetical protein n=1 Tax=unclassified Cyanobium TaxID=2627006 RepID=UPI0020CD46B2|nr:MULTISPECIES: hypothetical protein [unclassified Cyanobium]MCP9835538.1 hypothetical protein [Cyanobium sp. La Preciosa 7G6]MCP9938304.1 hypothetical protein [Cyanobium sp. Aljojuca 7A6]
MNPGLTRLSALAIIGGIGLLVLGLSRWDTLGPQSMICRHRDDPKGQIDFRVDVGQGDDRVRFADGQSLPVQTSRDRITFLEKESNSFHLSDNDGDEVALGHPRAADQRPGMAAGKAPLVIHPDHGHDEEHHTTIDRRALTFQENAIEKRGSLRALMMDGRCRLVASR